MTDNQDLIELESALSRFFFSSWDTSESSSALTVTAEVLAEEEWSDVLVAVTSVRDFITGGNLILTIEENSDNFEYRLNWESSGFVTCQERADTSTTATSLYSDDDTAATALEQVRQNQVNDVDDLDSVASAFIQAPRTSVRFRYRIPHEHVESYLSEALNIKMGVKFRFQTSRLYSEIEDQRISSIRSFLGLENGKVCFVTIDLSNSAFGDHMGFFSLRSLDSANFSTFQERRINLDNLLTAIQRECAIDGFNEVYLPPTVFNLERGETDLLAIIQDHVRPFQLMFCLLGISNTARRQSDSWRVRINGRKTIDSEIGLQEDQSGWKLESSNSTAPTDVSSENIDEFVSLFDWVYQSRPTDRITVLRNIITLYTTTVPGLLNEIENIFASTRTNFNVYIEDSVDEFIDFQQEVSRYVFETQREISNLRRDLSNAVSKDLFRVFGFILVTGVGILTQITKVTSARNALGIALIPVGIYMGLSLLGVRGLNKQFDSIEGSRKDYYNLYERFLDKQILNDITESGSDEALKRQFKRGIWLYYLLFGLLLAATIYAIIDLLVTGGLVSTFLRSILNK